MKKLILAAGALALLGSTAAQAADVVTVDETVVVTEAPAAVSWTGFYAGGTIGGSWAESNSKLKWGSTGSTLVKKKVKPSTFMGGLYAGYNFELANNIVLGVETDFLWNADGDSGSRTFAETANTANTLSYKSSVKQKWNGSTRLRAGYAMGAEKRFLPYVAAGVSYAEIDNVTSITNANDSTRDDSHRHSKSRAGWNVGVGVDYIPPIMDDHLVLRAEYRYTDFGKEKYSNEYYGDFTSATKADLKQKVDYSQNDFRVGVAYKF